MTPPTMAQYTIWERHQRGGIPAAGEATHVLDGPRVGDGNDAILVCLAGHQAQGFGQHVYGHKAKVRVGSVEASDRVVGQAEGRKSM